MKGKIFLIEDDQFDLDEALKLRTRGWKIVGHARDFAEACREIDKDDSEIAEADLVLIDLALDSAFIQPTEGLDLVQRLRVKNMWPAVVVNTNHPGADLGRIAYAFGASAFISKAESKPQGTFVDILDEECQQALRCHRIQVTRYFYLSKARQVEIDKLRTCETPEDIKEAKLKCRETMWNDVLNNVIDWMDNLSPSVSLYFPISGDFEDGFERVARKEHPDRSISIEDDPANEADIQAEIGRFFDSARGSDVTGSSLHVQPVFINKLASSTRRQLIAFLVLETEKELSRHDREFLLLVADTISALHFILNLCHASA